VSELFQFQLDLVAENGTKVPFDKLLGQKIAVTLALPGDKTRYFNGICSRFAEAGRDPTFTHYRMDVVPALWFLTRQARSRIFQQLAVPDILKKVFAGLDVSYELTATYPQRDFCVQYRETDFNFASRLMEEEGIFFFFKHSADGHTMVVADSSRSHPD